MALGSLPDPLFLFTDRTLCTNDACCRKLESSIFPISQSGDFPDLVDQGSSSGRLVWRVWALAVAEGVSLPALLNVSVP
jgi:hypothetical protein